MLGKHPRYAGVLKAVASLAGGVEASAKDRARGVAVHKSFVTYVAQIAEVSRGPGNFGAAGMRCNTCHQPENVEPAGIPGNPAWHLALKSMAWYGKSLAQKRRPQHGRSDSPHGQG